MEGINEVRGSDQSHGPTPRPNQSPLPLLSSRFVSSICLFLPVEAQLKRLVGVWISGDVELVPAMRAEEERPSGRAAALIPLSNHNTHSTLRDLLQGRRPPKGGSRCLGCVLTFTEH